MESRTYIKNIKSSPKKLRFLLAEIKRLNPGEAMDYLAYMPNKSAKVFYKVIKSALTNAKNTLKADQRSLRFKLLTVEEGQKLKRYKPGGKGMVRPILRRFSHIKIILDTKVPKSVEKVNKKELKVEEKSKESKMSNVKNKIQNSNLKSKKRDKKI